MNILMEENPSSLAKWRNRLVAACPEQEYRSLRGEYLQCFKWNVSAGRCHNKGCLLVSVLCLRLPSRLNRPNQKPEYANESTCRRNHKMLLLLFFSAFYVVLHCHSCCSGRRMNQHSLQAIECRALHTSPKLRYTNMFSFSRIRPTVFTDAGHSPLLGLPIC